MKHKSALTGDSLGVKPVKLTAKQATRLREYASRNGRKISASQYERDLHSRQER